MRLRLHERLPLAAFLLRSAGRHGDHVRNLPGTGRARRKARARRTDARPDQNCHRCTIQRGDLIMRKNFPLMLPAGASLTAAHVTTAQAQVKASEPASVSQTVDGTTITID